MSDALSSLNGPFKLAVLAGVLSSVKLHIARGDNLNARDSNGLTPLMLAAGRDKSEICKVLLEAGADAHLLDPSGKTAYEIAINASALLAAVVLAPPSISDEDSYTNSLISIPLIDLTSDTPDSLDWSNWESEETHEPPSDDITVSIDSNIIQEAISNHKPIDTSEEWHDLEIFLPEKSFKWTKEDDGEAQERLRLLLLRSIREGSLPLESLEELTFSKELTKDAETKKFVEMIINDLGAEVDERLEIFESAGISDIYINPEETLGEQHLLHEAFGYIESKISGESEPLRLFLKDMQRKKLITGEEEILLSQSMELELEKAHAALASWPEGIAHILATGESIINGLKPMSWFSSGLTMDADEIESPTNDVGELVSLDMNLSDEIVEDESEGEAAVLHNKASLSILDGLNRLKGLVLKANNTDSEKNNIRQVLHSLKLSKQFLMELAVVDNGNSSEKYVTAIKAYKKAHERMAEANLRLVLHTARKYLYSGEPLDDLVQEGNIGLFKAVDRYDWRLGHKFSTYATWWIRQTITRYLCDKCRVIRLPVHIHEQVNRLNREIESFESKMGRCPKPEELASILNTSIHKVKHLMRLSPEAISIDDIEIDKLAIAESKSSFTSKDPFEYVFKIQLKSEINNILSDLDAKQQEVIRLRNGLDSDEALTLEEVGKLHGVTRERIRQIEAKAMNKLKHPARLEILSISALGIAFPRDKANESVYEELD